jgi:hypothetical protein
MLYVVYSTNKKLVQKALKEYQADVLSWSELLELYNKKKIKSKRVTDEVFSLDFDTCLNSTKKEPGLKQCTFVLTGEHIQEVEDVICENFELLETNKYP